MQITLFSTSENKPLEAENTIFRILWETEIFLKKPLWFINLANWLDSRFYMIYFNFHGVISFKELKMS